MPLHFDIASKQQSVRLRAESVERGESEESGESVVSRLNTERCLRGMRGAGEAAWRQMACESESESEWRQHWQVGTRVFVKREQTRERKAGPQAGPKAGRLFIFEQGAYYATRWVRYARGCCVAASGREAHGFHKAHGFHSNASAHSHPLWPVTMP